MNKDDKIRIFISYSHDPLDTQVLDQMMHYLAKPVTDAGGEFWSDRKVNWGRFWDAEIKEQMEVSDIAIVLVSQSFLNSPYIADVELDSLLENRQLKKLIILPVILRECDWENHAWLSSTQFFPGNGKTVLADYPVENGERDKLFQRILGELRLYIQHIRQQRNDMNMDADGAPGNVHIVTSVKGGVGKTLLSLAVLCGYRDGILGDKRLLCVDSNTTNTDLFRLLTGSDKGQILAKSQWRHARIEHTENFVVKRRVPYSLFQGAYGFWEELKSVIMHQDFLGADVIVDTNLHIANLMEGGSDLQTLIEDICIRGNRRVFIWIIWNFASLLDDEYVQNGVAELEGLRSQEIADRLNIVHVLNPSALMAPQNNMQDEINALIQIQHRREEYNRLIMEMEEEGRTEDATQLRNLRDNYLRDKLGEFPIREIDLEVSRPFPGLDELANKELVVEDIGYNEFVRTVGGLITDVQDDYLANVLEKIYQTHFKGRGRPRNMLVVCRHDPKLRGYTEFFSVGDLEMIAQRISSITQDVSRFLGALDGVRS